MSIITNPDYYNELLSERKSKSAAEVAENFGISPSTVSRAQRLMKEAMCHDVRLKDSQNCVFIGQVYATGGLYEVAKHLMKKNEFIKSITLPTWVFENQYGDSVSIQEFLYK